MKKQKKVLVGILLLGVLLIMSSGCTGQQTPDSGTVSGEKSAGALTADVVRLEGGDYGYPQPFTVSPRGPGFYKLIFVFDSLVERDDKGIIPWLAESWSVSDDGREYTFNLREDVFWQDGVPFTADDVKFTYDYELEHVPVWGGLEPGIVESVEVTGSNTVKFVLNEPTATFLYKLTGFMIIPEHIYKDVSDPMNYLEAEAITGTGPYYLTDYDKEHGSYKFVANEDYWGPAPAMGSVEFVPVSDEVIAFEQGDIDFTTISPDVQEKFSSDPDVRVELQHPFWGYELFFNMNKRPVLNDPNVRQAFAYAIDRGELVEKIARGAGEPGNMGILPDEHIWYNSDQPAYSYDPEKAAELLKEAGWEDTDGDGILDKDGEKLSFVLTVGSSEARIGELIKERLGDVGIDVEVKALESKSRDANLNSGNYELGVSGFGGWGNDADYLRTRYSYSAGSGSSLLSGAAVYGYINEDIDKLGEDQLHETDENKRKEIVFEMQEILAGDVPTIPLYYTENPDAWRISTYDGWISRYDHHSRTHSKLSFLKREGIAAER